MIISFYRYKVVILSIILLNGFYFIHGQIKFPDSNPELGYIHSEVHARVAFPHGGSGRIWLKGSGQYNIVNVYDSRNELYNTIELRPPFFTEVLDTDLDEAIVAFCDMDGKCIRTAPIFPNKEFNSKNDGFSIMLYGCVEPFEVIEEDGKAISRIFQGENNSSYRIRKLFSRISQHKELNFSDSINVKNKFYFNGIKNSPLLNQKPELIITTGDQVYVDAGYKTKVHGQTHPISAWQSSRRPHPYDTSVVNYTNYLNKLYNASYSFEEIEQAHRILPAISTIDDHEIRDGWGSQGDEYENNTLNKELAHFYLSGKNAFIEHQLKLSIDDKKIGEIRRNKINSMHYNFTYGGINGFVFDLRSARNINEESILGAKQWQDFENWLENLEDDQEIILVTSIPLTLRPLKLFENIFKLFKPELRDDVRDGWSYRKNVDERNRLINLLVKYRMEKSIKPIFVSGDAHKSALIEIWVDPYADNDGSHDILESMVLGYEILASGLSHEFIKTGISKSLFKITESQRIGDGFIEFKYKGNKASLYPMVRNSTVSQNFGAIEFNQNKPTKLHTFIYDNDSDALQQLSLELDFDKRLPNDDYYIIKRNKGKVPKIEFNPPKPHSKRAVIEQ